MASIETPVSRRLASVKNIIIVVSGKGAYDLTILVMASASSLTGTATTQEESAKVHPQSSSHFHFSTPPQRLESVSSTLTLPAHPSRGCLDSTDNQYINRPTDGFPYTPIGNGDLDV